MQFNVGDIVEHMVYGYGMVEELWSMNGTDYATVWVFNDKHEEWGWDDQKAEVMLKYLTLVVAHP